MSTEKPIIPLTNSAEPTTLIINNEIKNKDNASHVLPTFQENSPTNFIKSIESDLLKQTPSSSEKIPKSEASNGIKQIEKDTKVNPTISKIMEKEQTLTLPSSIQSDSTNLNLELATTTTTQLINNCGESSQLEVCSKSLPIPASSLSSTACSTLDRSKLNSNSNLDPGQILQASASSTLVFGGSNAANSSTTQQQQQQQQQEQFQKNMSTNTAKTGEEKKDFSGANVSTSTADSKKLNPKNQLIEFQQPVNADSVVKNNTQPIEGKNWADIKDDNDDDDDENDVKVPEEKWLPKVNSVAVRPLTTTNPTKTENTTTSSANSKKDNKKEHEEKEKNSQKSFSKSAVDSKNATEKDFSTQNQQIYCKPYSQFHQNVQPLLNVKNMDNNSTNKNGEEKSSYNPKYPFSNPEHVLFLRNLPKIINRKDIQILLMLAAGYEEFQGKDHRYPIRILSNDDRYPTFSYAFVAFRDSSRIDHLITKLNNYQFKRSSELIPEKWGSYYTFSHLDTRPYFIKAGRTVYGYDKPVILQSYKEEGGEEEEEEEYDDYNNDNESNEYNSEEEKEDEDESDDEDDYEVDQNNYHNHEHKKSTNTVDKEKTSYDDEYPFANTEHVLYLNNLPKKINRKDIQILLMIAIDYSEFEGKDHKYPIRILSNDDRYPDHSYAFIAFKNSNRIDQIIPKLDGYVFRRSTSLIPEKWEKYYTFSYLDTKSYTIKAGRTTYGCNKKVFNTNSTVYQNQTQSYQDQKHKNSPEPSKENGNGNNNNQTTITITKSSKIKPGTSYLEAVVTPQIVTQTDKTTTTAPDNNQQKQDNFEKKQEQKCSEISNSPKENKSIDHSDNTRTKSINNTEIKADTMLQMNSSEQNSQHGSINMKNSVQITSTQVALSTLSITKENANAKNVYIPDLPNTEIRATFGGDSSNASQEVRSFTIFDPKKQDQKLKYQQKIKNGANDDSDSKKVEQNKIVENENTKKVNILGAPIISNVPTSSTLIIAKSEAKAEAEAQNTDKSENQKKKNKKKLSKQNKKKQSNNNNVDKLESKTESTTLQHAINSTRITKLENAHIISNLVSLVDDSPEPTSKKQIDMNTSEKIESINDKSNTSNNDKNNNNSSNKIKPNNTSSFWENDTNFLHVSKDELQSVDKFRDYSLIQVKCSEFQPKTNDSFITIAQSKPQVQSQIQEQTNNGVTKMSNSMEPLTTNNNNNNNNQNMKNVNEFGSESLSTLIPLSNQQEKMKNESNEPKYNSTNTNQKSSVTSPTLTANEFIGINPSSYKFLYEIILIECKKIPTTKEYYKLFTPMTFNNNSNSSSTINSGLPFNISMLDFSSPQIFSDCLFSVKNKYSYESEEELLEKVGLNREAFYMMILSDKTFDNFEKKCSFFNNEQSHNNHHESTIHNENSNIKINNNTNGSSSSANLKSTVVYHIQLVKTICDQDCVPIMNIPRFKIENYISKETAKKLNLI